MSLKSKIIKGIYKLTPNAVIIGLINRYIAEFGKVLNFNIDGKSKELSIKVLLAGETESINLTVHNYKIVKTDNKVFFVMLSGSSDRLWVNAVLQKLVGNEFRIPEEHLDVIEEFLGTSPECTVL
ncbi:MAG: hypothetical protein L3J71_08750 [Victivallaceae bacterium]|nr:hypothetical protein [Victivallaceae bacterium]